MDNRNSLIAARVAARIMRALETRWVGNHKQYIDAVWEMYRASYAKIGMHISGPAGLMEYDKWELIFDGDKPIAFNLYKSTPLGLKAGLLGSDGSAVGKSAVKSHIKDRFKNAGVYAEVSHAVEALSAGVPVVCAIHVPKVLGKTVLPLQDGIHYKRNLEGVGVVTKKLVGHPKGGLSSPEGSCPAPEHPDEPLTPQESAKLASSQAIELAEHAACQIDLTFNS